MKASSRIQDSEFRIQEVGKRTFCLLSVALFLWLPCTAQAQPRLAILDFQGERAASEQLQKLASQSEFALVDPQQLNPALKGAGYHGSLNMTLDEARGLGMSIGCDYYLLGIAKALRRLADDKTYYFDVMLAAFLVETRSGKLRRFAFEKAQVKQEAAAQPQLAKLAETIWRQCADAIKSGAARTVAPLSQTAIYDLSSEEANRLKITPPQFYRRVKPAYTDMADFADITATIEVKAIFQSDGRIGEVEVIRWGGFGLDESAVATVQQLRFEPAKLSGRAVSVSAVAQYNFRKEEKAK